jgi:hypothetical protein
MFLRSLALSGHVKRFRVRDLGADGWEVSREEDSAVTRQVRYLDWHRVERALRMFESEVTSLEIEGWVSETSTAQSTNR